MSNTTALIMNEISDLNWIGFYLLSNGKLWLGPFQGKPACTEIALGRGVCGQAFQTNKVMVVDDVHQFQDHIVCDPSSRSEMVIPIEINGNQIGVLDVDSPKFSRFDAEIQKFLKEAAEIFVTAQKDRQPEF